MNNFFFGWLSKGAANISLLDSMIGIIEIVAAFLFVSFIIIGITTIKGKIQKRKKRKNDKS